jgi:outer membrane protease
MISKSRKRRPRLTLCSGSELHHIRRRLAPAGQRPAAGRIGRKTTMPNFIRSFVPFLCGTACLGLLLSSPGYASPANRTDTVSGSLGLGFARLDGHTLYHISDADASGNSIESELKFPLNTTLFGLQAGIAVPANGGRDSLTADVEWFTSRAGGAGKVEDFDWLSNGIDISLVGSAHPGLDIYSLSEAALTADILHFRCAYRVWPADHIALGPFAGLFYERFSYDVHDLNQVGFGPYAASLTGNAPGPVLTYKVTYVIPYLGARGEVSFDNGLGLMIDLGYSPYATASDEDNHLLRYKLSKGSTSGNAYLTALAARWEFLDTNSVMLQWQYLKITTTGTQTQSWYFSPNPDGAPAGYTYGGIADRITSEQTSLSLLFSHRF